MPKVCDTKSGEEGLDLFRDGMVVRLFADYRAPNGDGDGGGHKPEVAARLVSAALDAAGRAAGGRNVSLVVAGAGFGRLERPVDLDDDWWTEDAVQTVEKMAADWARQFQRALGDSHPPVTFGLDGKAGYYDDWSDMAAQLAVHVEPGASPHVTWKSVPVYQEHNWLRFDGDEGGSRVDRSVASVEANHPIGVVDGVPALFLVCHDGTAFANTRWLRGQRRGSWRLEARYQLLEQVRTAKPALAVNVIHKLPFEPEKRLPPIFKNGHDNLSGDGRKTGVIPLIRRHRGAVHFESLGRRVAVVAVSCLHPDDRRFDEVAAALRCDFAHIDVHAY